ncbi:MAG TPA: NUDIX domain-containing protein [Micromonosporaceae bacterium]
MLDQYQPGDPAEAADLARARRLVEVADPWSRANPLHLTGSALIVHPPTGRVLLRWHARQQAWLQIGGHGDPGEVQALAVALREGQEETGLTDLTPWPGSGILHLVVVPVPAAGDDPAHEHADVRFVLATDSPELARPEHPGAPLRWLTLPEATALTGEDNLKASLRRLAVLLD